jgi:hypothetical protein
VDWLSGERRFPAELHLPDAACIMRVHVCIQRGEHLHETARHDISSAILGAEQAGAAATWGLRTACTGFSMSPSTRLSRGCEGFGACDIAVVRHFALNLVHAAKDRKPVRLRRRPAAWTADYLDRSLPEKVQ